MKKRIFAIIALGAALCSCSKEELTPADKIEYTLDIDCCFEDDTKALKSEFVENDYVYFIFDKLSGYLRLKKTATGWSYALGNNLTLQAIGENTSKRYRAFWVDGNTIGYVSSTGRYSFDARKEIAECSDEFTVSDNGRISLRPTMKLFNLQMKFTITGITGEGWTLNIGNTNKWCKLQVDPMKIDSIIAGVTTDDDGPGTVCQEGVYFAYYAYNIKYYTAADPVFTLKNGTSTFTKTFTGKTLTRGTAIKTAGPSILDCAVNDDAGNGWTKTAETPAGGETGEETGE